jgi:hypothetical protein
MCYSMLILLDYLFCLTGEPFLIISKSDMLAFASLILWKTFDV